MLATLLSCSASTISAWSEARPLFRSLFPRRRARAANQSAVFSLQRFLVLLRKWQMRLIMSPFMAPTLALVVTHATICSWPKSTTRWLTFLLRVAQITACMTHTVSAWLAPNPMPQYAATMLEKVSACAFSAVGWLCLLCCAKILDPGAYGAALVVVIVTLVALKAPNERAWRGCILVFWGALAVILITASVHKVILCSKQHKQYLSQIEDVHRSTGRVCVSPWV